MGREPDIRYIDTPEAIRPNYQYFTEARMERIRALGFPARTSTLDEDVRVYVQDYLAAADRYR
jgi:ADP-L-glycero-D-manno-heptose 6-epimerase